MDVVGTVIIKNGCNINGSNQGITVVGGTTTIYDGTISGVWVNAERNGYNRR